jgi:hypothetical protein
MPLVAQTSCTFFPTDTSLSPVTTAVTRNVHGPITTTWHTPPPAPAAKLRVQHNGEARSNHTAHDVEGGTRKTRAPLSPRPVMLNLPLS